VTYRTGNHWGVTIVRDIDSTEPCGHSGPEDPGHDRCAQLVAVVVNGDQTLAERICALLNQADGVWTTLPIRLLAVYGYDLALIPQEDA
jgi:hypothetical protein